jgi:diadenosine tetraphosphate (Ap4A) HIT family hydrolase
VNDAAAQFRKKFRLDDLLIFESEHWVWSLRPLQCTLGAGILSLKPYAERLSDASPEAGRDLISIVRVIERTVEATFAYEKINYLMLMMVDPPVHYHVVPRYGREIDFAGVTWRDAGWPKLPVLEGGHVDDATLESIRGALVSRLPDSRAR